MKGFTTRGSYSQGLTLRGSDSQRLSTRGSYSQGLGTRGSYHEQTGVLTSRGFYNQRLLKLTVLTTRGIIMRVPDPRGLTTKDF